MRYPGRHVKVGEADPTIVAAVKLALNRKLVLKGKHRLDTKDPSFDIATRCATKHFQVIHGDPLGRTLRKDGVLDAQTWAAMFGTGSVASSSATANRLLDEVLRVAADQEKLVVREAPPYSNRGPEVDKYLQSTGTPPGNPWCCAFVYWCFREAAQGLGVPNPMYRTASCVALWHSVPAHGGQRLPILRAKADPSAVGNGMIFVIEHGDGTGHVGLVESFEAGTLTTLEGNTNPSGGAAGYGLFRLQRPLTEINTGFIAY